MAAQHLTATKIDKHRPAKNDELLSDGNGLYLRWRSGRSGGQSRVWVYAYKVATQSVYLTLGEHLARLSDAHVKIYNVADAPALTLATARRIAAEMTAWRKRGVDPKAYLRAELARQEVAALRQLEEAAAQAAEEARLAAQADVEHLTVRALFDAWLRDGVRRLDGNAELRRSFGVDVLPAIGHIAVREVSEHDLRALLRTMVARAVNRAAVMMRHSLMQMFAWAEKRQPWRRLLANGNPMDLIEIEKIVAPDYDLNNQRERVLAGEEIRELRDIFLRLRAEYEQAPDRRSAPQPIERGTELAVWIMLSTLCRVGELSKARWEHIDFETARWHIPKGNVKGRRSDFDIFLSHYALTQFRLLHQLNGDGAWCFPARNKDGHLDVKSISKQIGDRQARFKKGSDGRSRRPMQHRHHSDMLVLGGGKLGAWTPHDLRRTGATMMQGLGVSLEVIDRCQNHVLSGSKVRRHYLHHDYAHEKRQAWGLLGDRLARLLSAPQ